MRGEVGDVTDDTSGTDPIEPPMAAIETLLDILGTSDNLKFEKLPMILAVALNEKAKEEGISLNDFLLFIRMGLQAKLNGPDPLVDHFRLVFRK